MVEAEKDDWLDDLDSSEDISSELDQSNIDALLAGTSFQEPSTASPDPAGEQDGLELDQSSIDAMLSGADQPADQPLDTGLDNGGLEQSDIEALLSTQKSAAQGQTASDPDQDEIDKLFSDIDTTNSTEEENLFPGDDINFKDVFDSPDSVSPIGSTDFDADEFKLDADIPDIPQFKESNNVKLDAPELFENTVVNSTVAEPSTKPSPEPSMEHTSGGPDLVTKVRMILADRKALAGFGAGLAVLLIVAGVFFFKRSPSEVSVQPPSVEEPQQPTTPPPAASLEHNAAPTVANLDLTMPAGSTQLAITLKGADPEDTPLEYEFQSMPKHGQLTGHAPNLLYAPKPDFSGSDSFTVRATDGQSFSPLATVKITRQPPVAAAAEPVNCPSDKTKSEEISVESKQDVIRAGNKSYVMTRSNGLIIDWKKIWGRSNELPYNQDVMIDILSAPRHGSLNKLNNNQMVYKPERSFRGTDTIEYRFKLGNLVSPGKTVKVTVNRTKKAPVVHLQPIAPVYSIADTVILNASQTTDANRDTLTFKWQQLSGVPVLIKPLNSEGSQISFVAPATFNTISNPAVRFKVTATNQYGAHDSKEITVHTRSLRHSAIWMAN